LDSPAEIAKAYVMRAQMGLPGGQLIANPIPEADEIAAETLAPIIKEATEAADAQGIAGKEVTPFLLSRIFDTTEGKSLTANIALVLNNARVAAKIATEISSLSAE
jgi:pseudouridine-5'-phosphate glycosidase